MADFRALRAAVRILLIGVGGFFALRYYVTAELEQSLLRRPTALSPRVETSVPGLVAEPVALAVDGDTIKARWVRPALGDPIAHLFIAHGGQPEWIDDWFGVQQLLAANGIASFVFDYVGFGESEGSASRTTLDRDLDAAWAAFARDVEPRDPVYLLGLSHGCAMLLDNQAIFDARPAGIVLLSCYATIRDALHDTGRLRRPWNLLVPDLYNNVEAAAGLRWPLLQIHGEADRIAPIARVADLFAAAPQPKHWIAVPGMTHDAPFKERPASVWGPVVEFIGGGERAPAL